MAIKESGRIQAVLRFMEPMPQQAMLQAEILAVEAHR